MFGVSFSEVFLVGLVALFVVGPQRLPAMLGTLGQWVAKLRRISTEVRSQIGIDEMLRKEGLHGGLNELRGLMRGNIVGAMAAGATAPRPVSHESREISDDRTREYPPEGPDAYGAVPDDLIADKPAKSAEPTDDKPSNHTASAALEAAPSEQSAADSASPFITEAAQTAGAAGNVAVPETLDNTALPPTGAGTPTNETPKGDSKA